jgi:hypothetical protein
MRMTTEDDLRPEYDLSKLTLVAKGPGRRGKGAKVELAPDVARVFPTADAGTQVLHPRRKEVPHLSPPSRPTLDQQAPPTVRTGNTQR